MRIMFEKYYRRNKEKFRRFGIKKGNVVDLKVLKENHPL